MGAPYNNLLTKLEAAAEAYYAATVTSPLTTFTGIEDATRTVPNVTFIATQGSEFPQGSGNFTVTLQMQVVTSIDETTIANHKTYVARAFDAFMMDDLSTQLSAQATDFFVLGVNNPRISERTEARLQISELELDCYACATDC